MRYWQQNADIFEFFRMSSGGTMTVDEAKAALANGDHASHEAFVDAIEAFVDAKIAAAAPTAKAEVDDEPETEVETADESAALSGKLPDDFPGLAALQEAGITTYAKLAKVEDLTAIDGIGPATAEKIQQATEG